MAGKRGWQIAVALWAMAAMAGCARAPVAARSVPYLREHPRVLQTLVRWCSADPGHLANVPTCVNAREAALLNGIGTFRKLPPMAFPPVPGNSLPQHGSAIPAQTQR